MILLKIIWTWGLVGKWLLFWLIIGALIAWAKAEGWWGFKDKEDK